jgi:hypothetical protein
MAAPLLTLPNSYAGQVAQAGASATNVRAEAGFRRWSLAEDMLAAGASPYDVPSSPDQEPWSKSYHKAAGCANPVEGRMV